MRKALWGVNCLFMIILYQLYQIHWGLQIKYLVLQEACMITQAYSSHPQSRNTLFFTLSKFVSVLALGQALESQR